MTDEEVVKNINTAMTLLLNVQKALGTDKQMYILRAQAVVCDVCQVSISELKGDVRRRIFVEARCIYAHHARRFYTLKQIGHQLGDKDHSSIFNYLKKYDDLYETDPAFAGKADQVSAKIAKND